MAECSFLKGAKALPHVSYGRPRDSTGKTGTDWQGGGWKLFPLEVRPLRFKGRGKEAVSGPECGRGWGSVGLLPL